MTSPRLFVAVSAFFAVLGCGYAQNILGNLSFSVEGGFSNAVSESKNSILVTDNNLSDGYASGFDLKDAPSGMTSSGPAGSAGFQWGKASANSSYAHSSALWFAPTDVGSVSPEQVFKIADLYYRNGTIVTNTGATAVDLSLKLTFANGSGLSPVTSVFNMVLENTLNSNDPAASADIVRLGNTSSPLTFKDASGNTYYLNLSFRPDANTLGNTLSTADEFRVYEGTQGKAELWGQFSTSPAPSPVPEPSAALLGGLASLLLLRRNVVRH
ncbi:choice-of-anchor K domain-containing protein [Luteolibacter ambystomatis]|uniref:Choice-of-anchor K domain-containing protein n=1 Tax=Luteolibacter ambystomatis TaxID=2824561 RepID=A0A975G714_9BACT|nr:choice-of-anchor K domain-containing protein [Luteolibacter ambystomatis]QUE49987.1 choice-of-anchor K domain-containing protein [Luteolibacter ambystomatis]